MSEQKIVPGKAVECAPNNAVSPEKPDFSLIDENFLKSRIYTIRGLKVMLDVDLAEIYGYSTKRFNEQVKCNVERFDVDFRFQLKKEEMSLVNLRSEKGVRTIFWTGYYSKFSFLR